MKVLSLFAGIGGFDLGLERAGHTIVGQVEWDQACRRVLRRHFKPLAAESKRLLRFDPRGDITTYRGTPGSADLVCGGFPCQDLSVAGRRAGLAGSRSGLFFEFMRVVAEVGPRWVLIENVPGLLSSNEGRDMGIVLDSLAERGYGWAYRVLDAQYFGVAQRRRRVFIVGCAGDSRRAAQVLFEPESGRGDLAPSRQAGAGVASHAPSRPVTSSGGDGYGGSEPGDNLVMAPAFSKRPGQQIATRQDGLSYALATGEPPRILNGGVRRLTPRECERLQGFPDGWTEGESDSARYRMLGNAVCVNVSSWIGRRLARVHGGND